MTEDQYTGCGMVAMILFAAMGIFGLWALGLGAWEFWQWLVGS